MFLDSVFGSDYGHKCKNYQPHGCNNSKGKHIFIFQIKSEGLNEAGVITSRIKDNARGYLDDLKRIFGRVSSGQLHIGQASSNNSPDKMELMRLYDELDKMLP